MLELAGLLLLLATVAIMLWQVRQQNVLLRAQLMRDRLETYWNTYAPVSDEDLALLRLLPQDYMSAELYDAKYRGSDERARRFIQMSRTYEFLAYAYASKDVTEEAFLGGAWVERWVRDLGAQEEFRDVHATYRGYYPGFAERVDRVLP